MAYYNRRTINKPAKPVNPFKENGKLAKGFYYAGNGIVKGADGTSYLIADYK